MRVLSFPILAFCLLLTGVGHTGPEAGEARPLLALDFEQAPPTESAALLVPVRTGKALCVRDKGLVLPAPEGMDWEQGAVEMAIRPDFDAVDNTYHLFFDVRGPGQGRVYLIKSGTGGANGLFLCVIDDGGRWMAASVNPGRGYSWQKGEWHRIGGSWDARRGVLKLFFDGVEVKETRTEPFRIGLGGAPFAIGAGVRGDQPAPGLLDDFRLYPAPISHTPLAHAATIRAGGPAWRAIDGNRGDGAGWEGLGCPNWLEIELPRAETISRVAVYPGDRRFAAYPSTELAPRCYRIQAWENGKWRDLTGDVRVPPYQSGEHRIVSDFPPTRLSRFRIHITEISDVGKRVDGRQIPEAERVVVIREVEWFTAAQVQAEEERQRRLRDEIGGGVRRLREMLSRAANTTLGSALRALYGPDVDAVARDLEGNAPPVAESGPLARRWTRLQEMLAPWATGVGAESPTLQLPEGWEFGILARVEGAGKGHAGYPVSVPVDLAVLERAWGTALDPYDVWVAAEDAPATRCPAVFERETPVRGRLWWVMRDPGQTRYLIAFRRRQEAIPERGGVTLGNGDRHYYDKHEMAGLPGPVTSAAVLDWDGDGKQDLLTGAWTDYVHFWRNVGTPAKMAFHDREHYTHRDEEGTPLLACPENPGLGFSFVSPVDVDGDGLEDLFLNRIYGTVPSFYRNLGPRAFPRLSRPRQAQGLLGGRMAFGDLNGDGRVDALLATAQGGKSALRFQAGGTPDAEGTPSFAAPVPLELGGSAFMVESDYVVPALADLDDDGDLDLTYYVRWGHVYYSENTGNARQYRFAPPVKLNAQGKPVDIGTYMHGVRWGDADGDGDLDLICTTGVRIFRNVGDRKRLILGEQFSPLRATQTQVGPHRLQGFSFVDWDGDGDLDRVMTRSTNLDLEVEIFEGGYCRERRVVEVDANKNDWYGCPDHNEYTALYSNTRLVDWDHDGDLDLFITSEHGWRYGYIHYYENLGGGRFGPEVELRPGGVQDYVKFVPGHTGQGILVDEQTVLDYLSYLTAGNFRTEGGSLRFWFRPNWNSGSGTTHTLFHTEPNPSLSLENRDLHRFYTRAQEGLKIAPSFSLRETEAGSLRLQLWDRALETPALQWKAGEWHQIEVSWGPTGARITLDGKEAASDPAPVRPGRVGRRVYLGSRSVKFVQHPREYSGRYQQHPVEWIYPARGVFDQFEILGPGGESLLALDFENTCDGKGGESGARLRVGYRCTPDFADLTGDGLPDMVMMLSDGKRGGSGHLYLFPNVGTRTAPRLGDPVLLRHTDGKPMRCFYRTQITCADWDGDGRTDIFLATEHTTTPENAVPNKGLDYFRNEGTADRPAFAARVPQRKVIERIQPWHEMKIAAVDLDRDGRLDLVASADNGSFVFRRPYLDEAPLTVRFLGLCRKR